MKKLYILSAVIFLHFYVGAQIIVIPDANFKNALVNTNCVSTNVWESTGTSDADLNDDGEIDTTEALAVQSLNIANQNIASLNGIENFMNLLTLRCDNNVLTALDVSIFPNLFILHCNNNQLTSINLNVNQNSDEEMSYYSLRCFNNILTSLDLKSNKYDNVTCNYNQLTQIDWSEVSFIEDCILSDNQFESFDWTTLPSVNNMSIGSNPLTQLSLDGSFFGHLYIANTQLVSLDFSNCGFSELTVTSNPNLQSINVKNGSIILPELGENYDFTNNPSLQYVCVDDHGIWYNEGGDIFYVGESSHVQPLPPNVMVTSYCNFTPGGGYNIIAGNVKFDCSGSNNNVDTVQLNIIQGTTGSAVTNEQGNYFFYSTYGNATVTPQLETSYFTTTPDNYTFDFTSSGNTVIADFCITPNGVHPDLEITLLPLEAARPGFDADYQLVYKNKGTQVQSGSINLTFNDAVLDLVSAAPNTTSQSANNLTWDFTNLSPFETRTINFKLNVNSPMEIPAVNIDDVLAFTATISAVETDETPNDNTDAFNQIVVGSFDPNDKAVTEGSQIDITNVGDYLHYLVRFQNSGTAAAENVVVKDMLADNLDKTTLQIVSASHPFRSTLTSGNKLEFFFENINLPPAITDEPGSHGYVAFKIKPASTVGVGSIIENTAEIYFDFNFPIVTNTVSTTVTTLGNQQFDVNESFTMFPNPVDNVLNIEMKSTSIIQTINIYNTLGQLVKSSENANGESKMALSVDGLNTGAYLVEIISNNGKFIKKLIKL